MISSFCVCELDCRLPCTHTHIRMYVHKINCILLFLQIKDSLAGLKSEQTKLVDAWDSQQTHLSNMLQYQIFLRDTEAIDAMSSAHEVCK